MSADMVTLKFGSGMVETMLRRKYERMRQQVERGYRRSHRSDKKGIKYWASMAWSPQGFATRYPHVIPIFHTTMRLAAKLGLPFDVSNDRFKMFALDIGKFVRVGPINAYDILGRPFSSLDDGTYRTGADTPSGHWPADPRVAKVKRFLRRHLRREPTDKDVDTFVYMYFGSEAFNNYYTPGHSTLFHGLQNRHYNRNGRHWRRDLASDDFETNRPAPRRNQRRVVGIDPRGPIGRDRYHQYLYGHDQYLYGYGSASNSNNNWVNSGNNRPTSTQYVQNKSRVNTNKIKNKSYKNSIEWEEHTVNNLPEDLISFEPFSNGQKAIKIDKYNRYYSPQTFRTQARMSMTDAFNKNGNAVLFENPMTRQKVRRSNIKFVILKNKNTGRATKAKKNAANKIGDARRRQLTRRSTLARAKAAAAALKRKRTQ